MKFKNNVNIKSLKLNSFRDFFTYKDIILSFLLMKTSTIKYYYIYKATS